MGLELDEELDLGICFDCAKQDNCPKRPKYEHADECPDFEEVRWCLTPKGIFCTVTQDMGWDILCGKCSELAWELYEHRAPENALDKKTFASVVTDFGWCDKNDSKIDMAFELFVARMEKQGYIKENKEEN